jgi:hypothetical protein
MRRVADTSDPDGNACGSLGSGCVTSAGGAGADTGGDIDTIRGDGACGPGGARSRPRRYDLTYSMSMTASVISCAPGGVPPDWVVTTDVCEQ